MGPIADNKEDRRKDLVEEHRSAFANAGGDIVAIGLVFSDLVQRKGQAYTQTDWMTARGAPKTGDSARWCPPWPMSRLDARWASPW
jgi:hypothetical protein